MDHLDRLVVMADAPGRPGRLRPRPRARFSPSAPAIDGVVAAMAQTAPEVGPVAAVENNEVDAAAVRGRQTADGPAGRDAASTPRRAHTPGAPAAPVSTRMAEGHRRQAQAPTAAAVHDAAADHAVEGADSLVETARRDKLRSPAADVVADPAHVEEPPPAAPDGSTRLPRLPVQSRRPSSATASGEPADVPRDHLHEEEVGAPAAHPPRAAPSRADPASGITQAVRPREQPAERDASAEPGAPDEPAPAADQRIVSRGLADVWGPDGTPREQTPAHGEPAPWPGDADETGAPAEPLVVNVSVGRVEVVDAVPTAPPGRRPRPTPRLSLDDYLTGRR